MLSEQAIYFGMFYAITAPHQPNSDTLLRRFFPAKIQQDARIFARNDIPHELRGEVLFAQLRYFLVTMSQNFCILHKELLPLLLRFFGNEWKFIESFMIFASRTLTR
jgi:hypothetical protein